MKELDWYVLTVSPLCESAVASRLKRLFGGVRGAEGAIEAPECMATWVPIVSREVRRRGSRYAVARNVLPRYLFFGHAGAVPWLDVHGVMGVRGVLCDGDGAPCAIRAEVVGGLIMRVERGDWDLGPAPPVARQMKVVAERGKYKGYEGEVCSIDERRGVAEVLFDLFGGVAVEMNLDDVVYAAYASRRMIG